MQVLEEVANDRRFRMDAKSTERRRIIKVQRQSTATPFFFPYLYGFLCERPSKKRGLISSNGGPIRKRSVRKCGQSKHSWILRKIIHPTETKREMEDNHRPIRTQRLHRQPIISHGDTEGHTSFDETRDVRDINRYDYNLLLFRYCSIRF